MESICCLHVYLNQPTIYSFSLHFCIFRDNIFVNISFGIRPKNIPKNKNPKISKQKKKSSTTQFDLLQLLNLSLFFFRFRSIFWGRWAGWRNWHRVIDLIQRFDNVPHLPPTLDANHLLWVVIWNKSESQAVNTKDSTTRSVNHVTFIFSQESDFFFCFYWRDIFGRTIQRGVKNF